MKKHLIDKPDRIPLKDRAILKKITQAHNFLALWRGDLLKDPHLLSLLKNVELKTAASGKAMEEIGIIDLCRHCDQEEGGSCCGVGIENKYTSSLLLINLLLGNTLPEKRLWPTSCFFLSEMGCCLALRQVLCVNYLCFKIQRTLPPDRLARLQQITGEEMEAGFILDEAVKKIIGR